MDDFLLNNTLYRRNFSRLIKRVRLKTTLCYSRTAAGLIIVSIVERRPRLGGAVCCSDCTKINDNDNRAFLPTFPEVLWHKSQMSMVLVNVVEDRLD